MFMIKISKEDHYNIFTVGSVPPGGTFTPLRDFTRLERAESYVNFLNGGPSQDWRRG